jgi:hypothetical protein
MKVAGVATIALYSASSAVAVKTVAKHFPAAKSADAEETITALGPAIQGTEVSTFTNHQRLTSMPSKNSDTD